MKIYNQRYVTATILEKLNIRYNYRELKYVPNSVIFSSFLLSISAIVQFVADVIVETSSAIGLIPFLEFRLNFLALAGLSGLLAFHTMRGIQRHELDVTEDAVQVSLFVEICLIIGDIYYLQQYDVFGYEWFVRLPFLVFTSVNILLLIYIIRRLKLFSYNNVDILSDI